MDGLPPFPGFRPEAFGFLRALAANNNRDWFKPRKATFDDELVWPLKCLVSEASRRLAAENNPLRGDPDRALFRVYRDVRFSKNKDPYKTSASAVLSRTGDRKSNGFLYIHVQPEASFLGAGFWHPDSKFVRAWRGRMAANPARFLEVVSDLESSGLELSQEDTLKRAPRGFEDADSALERHLKLKSFTVGRRFKDDVLMQPSFADQVVRMAHDVVPLLTYGWAIDDRKD